MIEAVARRLTVIKTSPIIYLVAITIAEVLVILASVRNQLPIWGMVIHIVILATAIFHSSVTRDQPRQRILLSLALVPLVRIISLAMPLFNIPQIWWYPIIYAPLLVASFMVMRFSDYRPAEVGINFRRLLIQLPVALSGIAFGVVEYFILVKLPVHPLAGQLGLYTEPLAVPLVAQFTAQAIWWPALILVASTGFVEELIFRGVLQRSLVPIWGWWGIVYVSLLFAILHIGFLSWVDVVFVFAVAAFFAWVVKRTGSLLGVTLSHGITNTVLYLVVPFFL